MNILIVDDEQVALTSLRRLLKRRGLRDVEICGTGAGAIDRLKARDFDLVLLDLLMPGVDGLQVLEAAKPFRPETEFIMLTAVDDVATAVKALRLGAYDYLVKPVDNERLFLAIERAFERRGLLRGLAGTGSGREASAAAEAFADFVTQSPRMKELLAYATIMARSGNAVLLTGESGTGKELLARGVHRAGPHPEGPFVAVNVSSVSESLFESQFFGYVQGAFTGAAKDYKGYFEQADNGTLFLDEIGELPPHLQAKFLRVLEEKTVTRLGDPQSIPVDARIVSATNIDMDEACREGRFRLDLLYRLKQAHVHLPPLREREGDIPLLAAHFLKQACERHRKEVQDFSPEAMDALLQQEFPGNVRELARLVEHGVLVADTDLLLPRHLGEKDFSAPVFSRTLCSLREDTERHVAYVLSKTGGDRKRAADILGVTLRQVQRKLAQMKKDPRWQSLLDDI